MRLLLIKTCLLLLAVAAAMAARPLAAEPSPEVARATTERAMRAFNVPGMSVAVVHRGELAYAAGHGVLEAGKARRADEQSLFQIGSVSKAFTAAALALLVDEGKVGWDSPVIDYLPEFRMADPWVTREFTVRDLLTHRSGLPLGAGDLLMFPDGTATAADVIQALRYLQPATSFRSAYAYDNLMYVVAGEVVARVSGRPFEDFLEDRLLKPLGMEDCVAYVDRAAPGAAVATAHILVDGRLETTGTATPPLVSAAGGIACSARSMARWLQFILDSGRTADGNQLVSPAQFAQLTKPVTLMPAPPPLTEHAGAFINAYALGWNVTSFYGHPMLAHSGGVWGMTTYVALLPDQQLAVFASGNQMSAAPAAVVLAILHAYLRDSGDRRDTDWVAVMEDATRQRRSNAEEEVERAFAARNAESRPSLPLEAYAGEYRDPWYGTVHIALREGQLWFASDRNPPLNGPLEHFQYDTFVARWTDRRLHADAYATFALGPDGTVERIRMRAVSPATDFSFDFHDLDLARVPVPAGR